MFPLRCSVRRCEHLLERDGPNLRCPAGHHFDQAKQGYWPLLQPQDRKSLRCGDSDESVDARQRWVRRGFMDGMLELLRAWCQRVNESDSVPYTLDLGCGEGTFGKHLLSNEATGYCGIDLSKRALKFAAREWASTTWVWANADRTLPAADQSVDRVISLFGRRPVNEIVRVLKPQGLLIVAVPGQDDLKELREVAQQTAVARDRATAIAESFQEQKLRCVARETWQTSVTLDSDAIADAMAMSYRAFRHSQRQRMEELTSIETTLAAELLLFQKQL